MSNDNPDHKAISGLPDYSALKKLAAALWRQNDSYHGAAIMIGAGFSRSAARAGDASDKMPLWPHLARILAKDIDANSTSDPLRLAEEYCAYFGKQALDDVVKREINDAAWAPGEMHQSLLELPWSEVLTTNWDTLLERASAQLHDPVYSVVSRQEDLSSARSPRIVKLHGTVNVTEDLIFTQEDFRRYPQRRAVFVNFARQVFIENELCLLGFSGDDPNFLQWAGWVRDQMTVHVRRIYLVGALNLTAARRKYLESINVAPIDLADLVAHYDDVDAKHANATAIFLDALKTLRPKQPWDWSPSRLHRSSVTSEEMNRSFRDANHAAALLEQQLPVLRADRESYPGWLVCPDHRRWELKNQINDPYPNARNISALSPESRARLLYEVAWRHSLTYELPEPWLCQELLKICDPDKPCALSKRQQMEVALLLLKSTRWLDDSDSKEMGAETAEVLRKNTRYWPESADELAFHKAILARDRFDYSEVENLVENISGKNPVGKVRKAALLAELGLFEEGERLIAEAHKELLIQYRNDRQSMYLFSRLAWAHWLLRGVQVWKPGKLLEAFPSSYQKGECNPFDYVEHVQERISKVLERQRKEHEIEPSFEPGHFKDGSNTVTFDNQVHPLLLLAGISDEVGVPIQWDNVAFLVEPASRLVGIDGIDGPHRFSLAIRAASSDTSDTIKRTFSRMQVACMPQIEAGQLLDRCLRAVNYWRTKALTGTEVQRREAVDRLRVFIEVFARMMVRATPEQAKTAFSLALVLAKTPVLQHLWLSESLTHLVDYSLKSIPRSQHHELLLDAMLFPLDVELEGGNQVRWPNPIVESPGARRTNAALDRRIDEIIDRIAPCSDKSALALLRLLPLIRCGFLTEQENRKVAERIWGVAPESGALPVTGLFKSALLDLPSPNQSETQRLVRSSLFNIKAGTLFNPLVLKDIVSAAHPDTNELPDENEAIEYFNRLVTWRPKNSSEDHILRLHSSQKEIGKCIGAALGQSVVPSLPASVLSEENFEKLSSFYVAVDSAEVLAAFPYFAAAQSSFIDRVERIITRGMQDQSADKVVRASHAILKWRKLSSEAVTVKLTSRLIYVIASGRSVGLAALLWTADQMLGNDWLTEEQIAVLAGSVPVLFDSTQYEQVVRASREAISVSFVRAACVRLARHIVERADNRNPELVRVMQEAMHDPLPEVRFADMEDA